MPAKRLRLCRVCLHIGNSMFLMGPSRYINPACPVVFLWPDNVRARDTTAGLRLNTDTWTERFLLFLLPVLFLFRRYPAPRYNSNLSGHFQPTMVVSWWLNDVTDVQIGHKISTSHQPNAGKVCKWLVDLLHSPAKKTTIIYWDIISHIFYVVHYIAIYSATGHLCHHNVGTHSAHTNDGSFKIAYITPSLPPSLPPSLHRGPLRRGLAGGPTPRTPGAGWERRCTGQHIQLGPRSSPQWSERRPCQGTTWGVNEEGEMKEW